MSSLLVEGLHLAYGRVPVLRDVSFTLGQGKVLALLGPSGCGKTTLLRAIAGLETPTAGRIAVGGTTLFDGAAGTELTPDKRNLGLVFQSYALWPNKSVRRNVAFPLELQRLPARDVRRQTDAVLDSLGLGALADRYPHQLSGGQQQRVAIARAVVHEPPLVLLDEPLSNLDAKLREEARLWMRTLIDKMGITAVLVTHDQTEAMALADTVILLSRGRVEQCGTPSELYGAPRTIGVAEFMGSNNRLSGLAADTRPDGVVVDVMGTALRGTPCASLAPGQACDALIRLEHVSVHREPMANSLEMSLVTTLYLGERWECLFQAGEVRLRCYARTQLPGGSYHLQLPERDLWLFPTPAP